jgi:phosphatidate cytidylyltransferase
MVATPLAVAVVFLLPPDAFFGVIFLLFFLAAVEFQHIVQRLAPSASLWRLLVVLPLATGALFFVLRQGIAGLELDAGLFAAAVLLVLAVTLPVLLSAVEMRDGVIALGLMSFGVPFFALPPLGLYLLQRSDPWLVMIFLLMVWLGDTAAFFVGKLFGRHKLAPMVSPNKSWEGAIAGFLVFLGTATLWSFWRLGHVTVGFLALCSLTAVLAQLGDLVESLVKRGVGVKDSSNALPGHGGFFDRLDALTLAAPVFALGVWFLGIESFLPSP